eukprot:3559505-Alexandrium_andersonii.AAC.1
MCALVPVRTQWLCSLKQPSQGLVLQRVGTPRMRVMASLAVFMPASASFVPLKAPPAHAPSDAGRGGIATFDVGIGAQRVGRAESSNHLRQNPIPRHSHGFLR